MARIRHEYRKLYRQEINEKIQAAISELETARQNGDIDQKVFEHCMRSMIAAMAENEICLQVEDFFDSDLSF